MDNYFSRYIQLALSGDDSAFETLYNFTKDSVYFVALNVTKNEQDAHNIIQDSYIRAFENLSSLENTEIFDLWLNRIVANSTGYFIKQKSPDFFNCEKINIDEEWNESENYENLVQETVDDKDTRNIITELVDNLPDDQRLIILLHYYWKMNISAVSETLDISESIAKCLLITARKAIKESLKKFVDDGTLIRSVTLASIPYVLSEASKMQFLFKPAPAFENIISIVSDSNEENNSNVSEMNFSEQNSNNTFNSETSFEDIGDNDNISAVNFSEPTVEAPISAQIIPDVQSSVLQEQTTQTSIQQENIQELQNKVQPTNNTEQDYNPINTSKNELYQYNTPYSTSQRTSNTESAKPIPRNNPPQNSNVRDLERSNNTEINSGDNSNNKGIGAFLGTVTGKIAIAAIAVILVGGGVLTAVLIGSKNSSTQVPQSVLSTQSEQSDPDTSYRTGVTQIIEDIDNFSYKSNGDGTISITSYFGTQSDVFIPNEVDGKKVTKISAGTFKDCTRIKSITIPANIKEIDMSVLGDTPFRDCIYMENIYVNSQNKYFSSDNGVLYNSNKTKLIIYPSGRNEDTFNIPLSVKEIGNSAFYGCSLLEIINIPSDVTKIGEGAFSECVSVKELTIPSGVKNVEESLFQNCSALLNVSLPKGIGVIKENAFYGCLSLENIELPDGLTSIKYSAFAECSVLEYVTIPSSVTNIAMLSEEESKKLENQGKDVFYRSPYVIIKTPKGSYAEQYAKKMKISFESI